MLAQVGADVQGAEADHPLGVRLDEMSAVVIDHVPIRASRVLVDVVRQQRLAEIGVD